MDKVLLERLFSTQRMKKYFDHYPGNEQKAITHYETNILLSESFYPVLSIFEVAFRNKVNEQLTRMFDHEDWYNRLSNYPGLAGLVAEVSKAQNYITARGELVSAPKVIAELTLGFWVRLFNTQYQRILWRDLRRAFPNLERAQRQRHHVSAPLNRIRNFRNRIFHNEPVSWNLNQLEQIHTEIRMVINWMTGDLEDWINGLDRFPTVYSEAVQKLQQ